MRVALSVTYLTDTFYPATGWAVVKFPLDQTCCGQMRSNTGYPEQAGELARPDRRVFAGFDAVVAPSGSCAAMVRGYYPGLLESTDIPPTYELSEFLVGVLGMVDVGAHPPAGARREVDQPRDVPAPPAESFRARWSRHHG